MSGQSGKRATCLVWALLVVGLAAAGAGGEEPATERVPPADGAPADPAQARREGDAAPTAPAREAVSPGPVYVRRFEPMQVTLVRLGEVHTPVYFRSPFAEPAASDAAIDRCAPLAAGVGIADWAIFAVRVLAFPVEMMVCPVWQTRPLGD